MTSLLKRIYDNDIVEDTRRGEIDIYICKIDIWINNNSSINGRTCACQLRMQWGCRAPFQRSSSGLRGFADALRNTSGQHEMIILSLTNLSFDSFWMEILQMEKLCNLTIIELFLNIVISGIVLQIEQILGILLSVPTEKMQGLSTLQPEERCTVLCRDAHLHTRTQHKQNPELPLLFDRLTVDWWKLVENWWIPYFKKVHVDVPETRHGFIKTFSGGCKSQIMDL